MSVTLKEVAKAAGVDVSTASTVLGDKPKAAKFAAPTRQRILNAAKNLNYHPNAAAQALATRRTGTIGMILSDQISQGWANHYFAQQLTGVEAFCRENGFNLHVSLYNLSNLDEFVFPPHVHRRAVDGVILAGYVRSGVIDRFREFQVPAVCIGDNHEVREHVPAVCVDHVTKALNAVRYAASQGHHQIAYCALPTKRKLEIAHQLRDAINNHSALQHISFRIVTQQVYRESSLAGCELLDQLLAETKSKRATVVICTTLDLPLQLLKEMRRRSMRCPDDLSIIADNNDNICDVTAPPLTAMSQDLPKIGRLAAQKIISQVESERTSTENGGSLPTVAPGPLVVRESVAQLTSASIRG